MLDWNLVKALARGPTGENPTPKIHDSLTCKVHNTASSLSTYLCLIMRISAFRCCYCGFWFHISERPYPIITPTHLPPIKHTFGSIHTSCDNNAWSVSLLKAISLPRLYAERNIEQPANYFTSWRIASARSTQTICGNANIWLVSLPPRPYTRRSLYVRAVRMCNKIATYMIQFAQVDQRARRAQRCYRLVRSPHMNLWLQHKWNGHQLERSTDDVMWVRNAIRMTTYLSAIYVGGRIWHWWFLCICLYLLGVIKNNVLAKCLQMNWTSWVERKCVDNMSGPW